MTAANMDKTGRYHMVPAGKAAPHGAVSGASYMAVTQDNILAFFDRELALDVSAIGPDTLLFSEGIIDSFALVSLMTYLEDESGIRIAAVDVNLANLDSISRILAYVDRAIHDKHA